MLSLKQNLCISKVRDWIASNDKQYFILTGYAGSGKTTIIPYLIDLIEPYVKFNQILFAAPTAKAAKNIKNKMSKTFKNVEVSTIHKLIYALAGSEAADTSKKIKELKANYHLNPDERIAKQIDRLENKLKILIINDNPSFTKRVGIEDSNFAKLLIVDEASMVDEKMFLDIMSLGIKVLFIGDPGQLPPINGKTILSTKPHDFFLDEVHRQALDNPIIWWSMKVREGGKLEKGNYDDKLYVTEQTDILDEYNPSQDIVAIGKNITRYKITNRIRKKLGYNSIIPSQGELIMVNKNFNYKREGIEHKFINSDVYKIITKPQYSQETYRFFAKLEEVDLEEKTDFFVPILNAPFEESSVEEQGKVLSFAPEYEERYRNMNAIFGYCCTVHKLQGSQYDVVTGIDESKTFTGNESKWLYTLLTRAIEQCIVIQPTHEL